jgi:hypothetical protein
MSNENPRRPARLLFAGAATSGLIGAALIGFACTVEDVTLQVQEADTQLTLAAMMPTEIDYADAKIKLTDGSVNFVDGGAAKMTAFVTYAGQGVGGDAFADLTASLNYESGQVFLSDVSIIAISSVFDPTTAPRLQRPVDAVATESYRKAGVVEITPIVLGALEKAFREHPVVTLSGASTKRSLSDAQFQTVSFTDDAAVVTVTPDHSNLKIYGYAAFAFMGIWAAFGFYAGRKKA